MAKTQKTANGSALEFEARLWVAAGQAVPVARLESLFDVAQASAPAGSGGVPRRQLEHRARTPGEPQCQAEVRPGDGCATRLLPLRRERGEEIKVRCRKSPVANLFVTAHFPAHTRHMAKSCVIIGTDPFTK